MKFVAQPTLIVLMAFSLAALATPSWAAGNELRLGAELRAPTGVGGMSGKAEFWYMADLCYIQYSVPGDKGWAEFSVEVRGLEPGVVVEVMVGGIVVGMIDIDEFGRGVLYFDNTAKPNGPALQFPVDFPLLESGTSIRVGRLAGTLEER